MIRLSESIYERMFNAAVSSSEEICGLLGGELRGSEKLVKKVYFLENTEHSDVHYSANPKEQLDAVRNMRKSGLIPIGNFHSHPHSPSVPSEEDIRLAYDHDAVYLILSPSNKPYLRAFCIDNGQFIGEELIIE